jgi:single-strand DNA-binding protein
MASFNKVLLMGNLTRDPDLKVTPSGTSICNMTVACSRTVRSEKSEGGSREETTFVDVEAFGRNADSVKKFFNKGRPIFIEGRLRLNEWTNKAGEKRSKIVVVLENFVFVGSNPNFVKGEASASQKSRFASENADNEDVPF